MGKGLSLLIVLMLLLIVGTGIFIILQKAKTEKCIDSVCENDLTGLSLVKTNTYDVTPETNEQLTSWRPEIQRIGDRFYYAFNKEKEFALVVLDREFKQESYVNLFSGEDTGYFPTDMRTSKDDEGNFWYAFESARRNKSALVEKCEKEGRCDINKNGIAIYSETSLAKSRIETTPGCVFTPELIQLVGDDCFKGQIASDDPTPFFYNGRYYLLRRLHFSPIQNIIEFDSELNKINEYDIDLSSFIGDNSISQNAVVEIDGKLYLIGGVGIGKPNLPDSESSIYAFQLASDLSSALKMIELTDYRGEYDTRVTSARYKNGILYITYLNNKQNDFSIYLEAFDVKKDFASIDRARVFGWRDNNVELLDDKIYVAYIGDDYRLYLAEFEWKK